MTQIDDADDYGNSNDGNEFPTTETSDTLIEANVHDHQVLCPQKVRPNTSFPPSMPCKKWQHLMDYHKQCDIPLDPKDDGESHSAAPDDEKIEEDLEDELIGHVDAENGEDYDDDDLFKMMEPEDNESLTVSNCEKYSDAGHATNNGELLDTEGSLTVKSGESAEDFEYGDEPDHEKVYVDHCSYYGEYYADHSSYSEDFDGTVDKFPFHMIHNHKMTRNAQEQPSDALLGWVQHLGRSWAQLAINQVAGSTSTGTMAKGTSRREQGQDINCAPRFQGQETRTAKYYEVGNLFNVDNSLIL
jgi:hypothetical protein